MSPLKPIQCFFCRFLLLVLVSSVAVPYVEARTVNKKEASRFVREGEYRVNKKRVTRVNAKTSKKPSKKAARVVKRSSKISKSSKPSRKIASQPKKKPSTVRSSKKKRGVKAKHASQTKSQKANRPRVPVARETPSERDMPFVSVPHRRVSRKDKTFVMEDPSIRAPLAKPKRLGTLLRPDTEALSPEAEGVPAEVTAGNEANRPTIVGPKPASVEPGEVSPAEFTAESEVREPDAFDLHSGSDPMRGP